MGFIPAHFKRNSFGLARNSLLSSSVVAEGEGSGGEQMMLAVLGSDRVGVPPDVWNWPHRLSVAGLQVQFFLRSYANILLRSFVHPIHSFHPRTN